MPLTVSADNVIGIVTGSVAGLGAFAMFLQTPVGVLVFVGIPVVLYVIYDIIRISIDSRKKRAAEEERLRRKDEEIARLKALVSVPAEVAEAAAEAVMAAVEAPADSEVPAEMPAEVPEGELAPEEAPVECVEAAEPPVEG